LIEQSKFKYLLLQIAQYRASINRGLTVIEL